MSSLCHHSVIIIVIAIVIIIVIVLVSAILIITIVCLPFLQHCASSLAVWNTGSSHSAESGLPGHHLDDYQEHNDRYMMMIVHRGENG